MRWIIGFSLLTLLSCSKTVNEFASTEFGIVPDETTELAEASPEISSPPSQEPTARASLAPPAVKEAEREGKKKQ